MKKIALLMTAVALSCNLLAAEDEAQFLQPNLKDEAQKVLFAAGIAATSIVRTSEGCKVEGLQEYISQVADKMDESQELVLISDSSYDVVFTDNQHSEQEVYAHIESVLHKIADLEDVDAIKEHLSELTEVHRATFIEKENQLILLDDAKLLYPGCKVWRKYPTYAELTHFHTDEECLVAFAAANLKCVEIKRPSFFGNVKWKQYLASNQDKAGLGKSYAHNHPFTLFYVTKEGES